VHVLRAHHEDVIEADNPLLAVPFALALANQRAVGPVEALGQ